MCARAIPQQESVLGWLERTSPIAVQSPATKPSSSGLQWDFFRTNFLIWTCAVDGNATGRRLFEMICDFSMQ